MTASANAKHLALSFVLAVWLATQANADVSLPAFFSDHMVLQKSERVPVWGWADAGEKVTVSLDGRQATSSAGPNGKWLVTLDLGATGPGPHELIVEGKNRVVCADVLVGEVWLCSGQSNMELRLQHSLEAKTEIPASGNPMLREFCVLKEASATPQENCKGEWKVATPQTTPNFGGVAYYFGKTVQQKLGVPVGLIRAAWGGSSLEAWLSESALDSELDLKRGKETVLSRTNGFPEKRKNYLEAILEWQNKTGRQDRRTADSSAYAAPSARTDDWKSVTVPGSLEKQGLPAYGAIWLRRNVTVDAKASAEGWMSLSLGPIAGYHEVFWDGVRLGGTDPEKDLPGLKSVHRTNGAKIKPGEHTLAIRIFIPAGKDSGFLGQPENMVTGPLRQALSGTWLAKPEFELPPLEGEMARSLPLPPRSVPLVHHVASQLYNGMIHPLIPYAIKGVAWYQGETNAGRAQQYRTSFPLLIQTWRSVWERGDFPFYFCQLANYGPKQDLPAESAWAELREAQSKTLALPNTGQAVLIDVGSAADIHPLTRKEQGERLAKAALAKTYGVAEEASGPSFESVKLENNTLRIRFNHADGGLVARPLPPAYILRYSSAEHNPMTAPLVPPSKGSEVQGFAICGEDRNWKWAQAKIDGDSVVVWSPEIPKPVAVRYAWADNPTCNLYNQTGLPASPFRTDDFPGIATQRYFLEDSPSWAKASKP